MKAAKRAPVKVPLLDLKAQYAAVRTDLIAAATRVLDSGTYILGPEVAAFEAEFAAAQRAPKCLGLSSGTDALLLALEACGVGPGDEVVVPAFSFIATANVVSLLGAKPVFADVDPRTLTLDPAGAAQRLTKRTKAVMPVHLYGWPADLDPLLGLARDRGLKVVEDAAQAHLSEYKGRFVGTIGDAGAFSFYPTKNLAAAGDAGVLTTADPAIFETAFTIRDAGRRRGTRYEHSRVGRNCRLDELQAALLRVKLRRLAEWTAARRRAAARYRSGLKGLPVALPPDGEGGSRHCYHLFVVRAPKRDRLAKHLADAGIGSAVYYPMPLHLQPAYASLGHKPGDYPESEAACADVLALPMYAELAEAQVDAVCAAVRSFYKQ